MTDAMLEHLEEAAAAVSSEHPEGALAPLLAVWATVRAPALAEAIEGLSARVTRTRAGPTGDTLHARQIAWLKLAAAARPEDVGVLVKELAPRDRWHLALERIAALARFPPDPRIASALVDLVHPPVSCSGMAGPLWKRVFALLLQHADPRTLDRLATLPADYAKLFPRKLGKVVQDDLEATLAQLRRLFAVPSAIELPPDTSGVVVQLARLRAVEEAALRRSAETEAEFLRAITAEPHEDAPRLVYADWLLERGDPRGELIALQYRRHRGELSPEGVAREEALLARHRLDWLGPLFKLLQPRWSRCRFERGFLAVACVDVARGHGVQEALGQPMWATVEDLTLGEREDHAALFDAPVFPGLRILREATPRIVGWLARAPTPLSLEELEVSMDLERDAATVAALDRLPRLRVLAVLPRHMGGSRPRWRHETYRMLLARPLPQTLQRLRLAVDLDVLGRLLPDVLATSFPQTIELAPLDIHASRGPDGRRSELTFDRRRAVRATIDALVAALLGLPPSALTRFQVTGEASADALGGMAPLAEALRRFPGVVLETT